jgi:hypothetical protein
MKLEEVADLHNRRRDLEFVSRRAKQIGMPLLVWPEDKLLLRRSDLPVGAFNTLPEWRERTWTREFVVKSDGELREQVKPGYAYTIAEPSLNGHTRVVEYHIMSR